MLYFPLREMLKCLSFHLEEILLIFKAISKLQFLLNQQEKAIATSTGAPWHVVATALFLDFLWSSWVPPWRDPLEQFEGLVSMFASLLLLLKTLF